MEMTNNYQKQSDIVIHVGYPKAASTTLQKHLFNNHSEINNLGAYPTANLGQDSDEIDYNCLFLRDNTLKNFYKSLVNLEESDSIKKYKNYVYSLLDNHKINIFSNERLIGGLLADLKQQETKAILLNNMFPYAKICLIIRNQYKLIESQYRDHPFDPTSPKKGKPVSFSEWVKIAHENDNTLGYFNSLKYDKIINLYSSLFGKDKVKVLLFEDLVNNLSFFSKELANFLGIGVEETEFILNSKHENIGISYRFNEYRKLKRSFFLIRIIEKLLIYTPFKEKFFMILKSGKKAKYNLNDSAQALIKDYFRDSNKQLLASFPRLKKYQYPL